MPYGGIKMAEQACTTSPATSPARELHKIFTDYTRTHNQAVFDATLLEMKAARHPIITGLPDTWHGRGRIVGDYRRGPVRHRCTGSVQAGGSLPTGGDGTMTDDVIRLRARRSPARSAPWKGMKKMAGGLAGRIALSPQKERQGVLVVAVPVFVKAIRN